MPVGMTTTQFMRPHRPRPYSILNAAEVVRHSEGDLRWIGGMELHGFEIETYVADLTACDIPASGAPSYAHTAMGSRAARPFVSLASLSCGTLSGSETLTEMRTAVTAEHDAVLHRHVDLELTAGVYSGDTPGALAGLADVFEGMLEVVPGDILAVATLLAANTGWEYVVLVPATYFATAVDGRVYRDGDLWRSYDGHVVVPHSNVNLQSASQDVYLVPAPIVVHLAPANIAVPDAWVERSTNDAVVTSEQFGLIEFDLANSSRFITTPAAPAAPAE